MAVKRTIQATSLVLACWLTHPTWANERPLNIYIGSGQMPFASTERTNAGLFGDLMQQLCWRMQRQCHFKNVPWKRLDRILAQDDQGLALNVAYTPERSEHFEWLLDVWSSKYVLISTHKVYHNLPEALQDGTMVVMAGTPRAQQLQAIKTSAQHVSEVTDSLQAAQMLNTGRVNSWYEIDARARYLWRQLGLDGDELMIGPALTASRSHIAAGPNFKDVDAFQLQMQARFADMQRDGTWQAIVQRYLAGASSELSSPAP